MISEDTALAHLLDTHPGLLRVLVGYHPRFGLAGAEAVEVRLTFDPPWSPDRMLRPPA